MKLQKLHLQDFRKLAQETWEFSPQVTVLRAKNGAGKTTILEAINLLATGKSFRASKTEEMIRFGALMARAYGLTDEELRLGVTLLKAGAAGRKTAGRIYEIDKAKKRQRDFVGTLLTACFRPEDLRLIEGSSSRRRDYLDGPLELTSEVYRSARKNYQATLVRRNKTLQAIRAGELSADALPYWDENLLEFGEILQRQRQQYLDFVSASVPFFMDFQISYDHSLVTRERLDKYRQAEMATGYSLIGPHKDDLLVTYDFGPAVGGTSGTRESLMTYGSRGQHRLAVLWLKIAERQYLAEKTGQEPVLLLDDIFSELDEQAKELTLELITRQQTIITTTEENVVELLRAKKIEHVTLEI